MKGAVLSTYRFIGAHADELDGGRPVEPGEFVSIDEIDPEKAPKNAQMIEDGLLVLVDKKAARSNATTGGDSGDNGGDGQ